MFCSLAQPPAPGYIRDTLTFTEGLQRLAVALDGVTSLPFESPFLEGKKVILPVAMLRQVRGLQRNHLGSKTLWSLKDAETRTSLIPEKSKWGESGASQRGLYQPSTE